MEADDSTLAREYLEAMRNFLRNEAEPALQSGYELGRRAIAAGLGVLDMARLHQEALSTLSGTPTSPSKSKELIQAAGCFLMEALSPFEATHRGFREAYDQLRELNATLGKRNVELKTINEEIKTRERQLADAQRLAQLGSWEWNIQNNQVSLSDELYRIHGIDCQELNTTTIESYLKHVYPDDRDRRWNCMETAVKKAAPFVIEERILRPDGKVRVLLTEGDAITDKSGTVLGMVGYSQDITERRQTELALRESKEHYFQLFQQARRMEEDLRQLSTKMLHVQEEERTRISRELHDEVGQTLTAINMNLTDLRARLNDQNGSLAARLADSQKLLESSMENVHRFARELRPAILDDLGLVPALRSFAKSYAVRTGINVKCQIPGTLEKLDNERNTVIYRIVQECFNNIARHAQAHNVELTIRRQKQNVLLQVKDDGKGFRVLPGAGSRRTKRLGLLGMQERSRLVGGELVIESAKGSGTLVQAVIPLKGSPTRRVEKRVPPRTMRSRPTGTPEPTKPGNLLCEK